MLALFVNLLLAHLVGDFWLQCDCMVDDKNKKRWRGWALHVHAILVLGCTMLAGGVSFGIYAIAIAVVHWLVDLGKSYCADKPLIPFAVDQFLHVVVLSVAVVVYFQCSGEWTQYSFVGKGHEVLVPSVLCALVVLTRPTNILIKEIFSYCGMFENEIKSGVSLTINLNKPDDEDKMKNAGAIVGTLERLMAAVFVASGSYQALGFLLTAKSVLRFKLDDAKKSEYVLVGTLLSMSIVLACMLGLKAIKMYLAK